MSEYVQNNLWGGENPDDERRRKGLAPNGEGPLAPIDGDWASSGRLPDLWESMGDSIQRLGINQAESKVVFDTFGGLIGKVSRERHEQLLEQIAGAAPFYAELSTWTVDNTLAGEFVRWCQDRFAQDMSGEAISEIIVNRGNQLAQQFRAELESRRRV